MQIIDNMKLFKTLDRLFWLVWLAFPVIIWLSYLSVQGQSADLLAELPPAFAACADALPNITKFSTGGKAAVIVFFLAQFLIYGALLALAHLTIHRFARGQVFVADTLRTLGLLGIIIALWPFFDLLSSNLLGLAVRATGDMKGFAPDFLFDIGPFGVGLLIITLRAALRHAIAMKHDQDLTI